MSLEIFIVLAALALMICALMFTRIAPDVVFLSILILLMVVPVYKDSELTFGIISTSHALNGFSNPGMITIAFLFIVACGLQTTGAINWISEVLIGRPKSIQSAITKISLPVTASSAFLNNTPVVAMMIPVVSDLAKKLNYSPSKLMIPLSYAAILGGTCSLVGTSTNLVVNGMLMKDANMPSLGMFDITWIGLPCAIIGGLFLIFIAPHLLPDHGSATSQFENPKEYTVEMMVPPSSPLAGKTIQEAGLRHLPSLYLVEISRDEDSILAVNPEQHLQENDRLIFAGVIESVKELQNLRGLVPATNQIFKLHSPRYRHQLFEVVISNSSPLVGKTIRDGQFRSRYHAAVLAVARNNERICKKIGDIILQPGDTLLIEANQGFALRHQDSQDFFLVRALDDSTPKRHERAWAAILILTIMVLAIATNIINMLHVVMVTSILMILSRCCTVSQAKRSIDWSILVVIASAMGIGKALEESGAASMLANYIIKIAHYDTLLALIAVFIVTAILTEVITNNAAVAIVFPITMMLVNKLDTNFLPFILTIMMAGSTSFATPIGYQTNLMVYGPGGYRFLDYLKIGIPMKLLVGIITIAMSTILWKI